jgi:hypothetical protein
MKEILKLKEFQNVNQRKKKIFSLTKSMGYNSTFFDRLWKGNIMIVES